MSISASALPSDTFSTACHGQHARINRQSYHPTRMNQQSDTPPNPNELIKARRDKLQMFRNEVGINPYGSRVDGLVSLKAARDMFDHAAHEAFHETAELHKQDAAVSVVDARPYALVAGRCVQHRMMGKLAFIVLRDATGDLQISISKHAVDERTFKIVSKLDYGDIVVAGGPVGKTQKGEVCIWADRFELHCKSLEPPPEKFHGLSDAELRYRRRYVDLYATPSTMQTLLMRSRIVSEVRRYMEAKGFVEAETPMMQPIAGGAAARPFVTHHNALDMPLYLRIAPELYLKRLLVGGMSKVFELNRNFRNEGISPRHNPEFTMLEAYEAFGSWETMADLVEDMICTVAQKLLGSLTIEHRNEAGEVTRTINLQRPWRRVRMSELVEQHLGWRFEKQPLQSAPELMQKYLDMRERDFVSESGGVKTAEATAKWRGWQEGLIKSLSPAEQLVEVYEKLIEPTLIDPCFVTRVPSVMIPLARECPDDPFFADVYELAINGVEISPGYSELNDPDMQEKHFRHQVGDREEQQPFDEDFVRALRVGMPPAGGMGLGIDRLVMMLTGAASIRDVILFPLLKPE